MHTIKFLKDEYISMVDRSVDICEGAASSATAIAIVSSAMV